MIWYNGGLIPRGLTLYNFKIFEITLPEGLSREFHASDRITDENCPRKASKSFGSPEQVGERDVEKDIVLIEPKILSSTSWETRNNRNLGVDPLNPLQYIWLRHNSSIEIDNRIPIRSRNYRTWYTQFQWVQAVITTSYLPSYYFREEVRPVLSRIPRYSWIGQVVTATYCYCIVLFFIIIARVVHPVITKGLHM